MRALEFQLADAGFDDEEHDAISLRQASLLAACLDIDPPVLAAGHLPAAWHWIYCHRAVPTARLGADGHPKRRAAMDAFPQRMWVGGRVTVEHELRLDAHASRRSELKSTTLKRGSAGPFYLVTVIHSISQDGHVCVREEQDLIFRQAATARPVPGPARDDPPLAEHVDTRSIGTAQLFRFSALTFNAHRIHYDLPYARDVEHYPDLVVHGPLTALLLSEYARACTGRRVVAIRFRAQAPLFAPSSIWLTADAPTAQVIETRAVRGDHTVAMTLSAELA